MSTAAKNVFEYRIIVAAGDIDELEHVSNIIYLRWVQDAASAHWAQLSNDTINKKYVWVVMRHEIDYLLPALLNDEIIVRTWVGKNEGARSQRHTQLSNAVTGKMIAEALTTWCLLDAAA